MNTAQEILLIITALQTLAPEAIALVKQLTDKLVGATAEDIAALTHSLNATTIQEINAELASKKPA